ncbi:hypothetical protein Tco_0438941 [Tanacetum coccineum]
MLDATTALYCIARQKNNGKGKNKYNKNKGINHGDPKGELLTVVLQDFKTSAFLQRCNSHGEFYPVVPSSSPLAASATALSALSSDT